MLTRIDHTVIAVANLDDGDEAFRRLGFSMSSRGTNEDGSESAFVYLDEGYVELTTRWGVEGPDPQPARGLRELALESDDLDADLRAMRARGIRVGDVRERTLRARTGAEIRWREAAVDGGPAQPLIVVEHMAPLSERRRALSATDEHPNTAMRPERAYVAVPDVRRAAQEYQHVLDQPVPPLEDGTVIMSLMAVFSLGSTGIALAEPRGEGVTAEALTTWGEGPFQLTFQARDIDAATDWMAEHGLPPPARGIRLRGDQAILVRPEHACGTYVVLSATA